MELPNYSDVQAAASRLAGHVVRTPLIESQILNERLGARVFLKAECLQHTGSFKFRGAFNALKKLKASDGNGKVVAMSSGNHAQGVAEAARLLGFSSTIVMPADAPAIKQARTKRSGAEVVTYDRYKQDREEVARQVAEDVGAPIIHPYDDPDVISGQGTAGLESVQQLEELGLGCDRVLVCAGGGGLMTGIMLAMKHHFPNVSIHPVEPLGYDDHAQTIKTGKRCSVDTSLPSICDAILAPAPGKVAFELGKGNL